MIEDWNLSQCATLSTTLWLNDQSDPEDRQTIHTIHLLTKLNSLSNSRIDVQIGYDEVIPRQNIVARVSTQMNPTVRTFLQLLSGCIGSCSSTRGRMPSKLFFLILTLSLGEQKHSWSIDLVLNKRLLWFVNKMHTTLQVGVTNRVTALVS